MKMKLVLTLFAGCLMLTGPAAAQSLFDRLDANDNGVLGRGDRRIHRMADRDNNPPGRIGGRGTNWENPPGRRGGPGTSPNRRFRVDRDHNPPGPIGGRGTNWENRPGRQGGPGASPNRRGWR